MTFLPIVDRELRVAARRKSTYRIRTWTAVIAVGVGFFALSFALLARGFGAPGKPLYTTLTTYTFGLCLIAGVFLTADCLSEEKREGTLGLLFLTDLKGYDVVLGKFMAMSLNAFYGLLAILPITGLSLLLGGMTGGEFCRMTLALVNTLFFSLAAGICVSAFGRNPQRVMGGTLGLVILFVAVLPGLAGLGSAFHAPPAWACLAWISPYYPFAQALEPMYLTQPAKYWGSLGASQLLGWLLLALASRALPHCWQERAAVAESGSVLDRIARRSKGGLARPTKAREALLSANPVLWLASSGPNLSRVAWLIVGVWGLLVLLGALFAPDEMGSLTLSYLGVRPFGFLLKLLVAFQACHFFVEARRTGDLEMLLCAPLTSREIIEGQTLALRRSFLGPAISLLALLLVQVVVQVVTARAWHTPGMGDAVLDAVLAFFGWCIYCVRMYADYHAVAWFGMWLALTRKKPGMAPALTILFVLIVPSVLCWLDVLADLFFILWGMTRLREQDLRFLMARQYEPARAGAAAAPAATKHGLPPAIAR